MNSHESFGSGWDIVHDEYGRFVALLDPESNVVEHEHYEPTNLIENAVQGC